MEWEKVLIYSYNKKLEIYEGLWDGTTEKCKLPRIKLLFDSEDPRTFARRVKSAHEARMHADSLIKYHFFQENMPTDDLPTLDSEQEIRIKRIAEPKPYRNPEQRMAGGKDKKVTLEPIIEDVKKDYKKCMNKIIFDTYTRDKLEGLIEPELNLPSMDLQKETPYYGMITIFHKFPKKFSDFCFKTLYIKEEVSRAIVDIRKEGLAIKDKEIFETVFVKSNKQLMRIEEFKQRQDSAISQCATYMKETWVNKIKDVIFACFGEVGKGWFNIKEKSKDTYEYGKLKKLLTLIRLMMQEVVLDLSHRSLNKFHQKILSYLPLLTIVQSAGDVKNYYFQEDLEDYEEEIPDEQVEIFGESSVELRKESSLIQQSGDPPLLCKKVTITKQRVKAEVLEREKREAEEAKEKEEDEDEEHKIPDCLFSLDLILKKGEEAPQYSSALKNVKLFVQQVFDSGVKEFQKISQMEPKILPKLFKQRDQTVLKAPIRPETKPELERKSIKKLPDENLWVYLLWEELGEKVEKAVQPLYEYIRHYDKFLHIIKLIPEKYVQRFHEDPENPESTPSVYEIKADIYNKMEAKKKILEEIPEEIRVSMFKVNCADVRKLLSGKYEQIIKLEVEIISRRCKKMGEDMMIVYDKILEKVMKPPKDIEELTETWEFMKTVPQEIKKNQKGITELMEVYDMLEEFEVRLPKEDLDNRWKVFKYPRETNEKVTSQNIFLEKQREVFVMNLEESQEAFLEKIDDLSSFVESLTEYQKLEDFDECASIMENISERLKACQDEVKVFNRREMHLGKDLTDYSQVNKIVKEFTPYNNLWSTTRKWRNRHKAWMGGPWNELNGTEVQETVEMSARTILTVIRYFRDRQDVPGIPKVFEIATTIKAEIDKFKPYVPLALALTADGMKKRHWEELSTRTGIDVNPLKDVVEEEKVEEKVEEKAAQAEEEAEGEEAVVVVEAPKEIPQSLLEFNFAKVIEVGLEKHEMACVEVGEKAEREFKIELTLQKMKEEWKDIEFTLKDFKTTKTFFVTGFDDASTLLDDHIVQTQALQCSLFKEPFKEEIEQWSEKMMTVSEVIEEWVKVQSNWMYLQPIFDSPDIAKQLPTEANKFKGVDTLWRSTMNQTKESPHTLTVCTKQGLAEKLQGANANLEQIQKHLNQYLEEKRSVFARFYFLSNDELLQILSQTKEVENVRPHLKKVFENMHDMEFKQPEKTMHAMFSAERERIDFVKPVDPRGKNVEYWMGDVEKMMMISVRHVLLKSITDYRKRLRTEWMLSHPGQCILNGSQIHWTHDVEEGMRKGGVKGISAYFKKLSDQLMETVKKVREKLTKQQTICLNALIVLDVHAKDVVEKLKTEGIGEVTAFEWIMQLRYYWENNDCFVKCVQTNFPYGYEYLGNTLRLVITALTDRCFLTLMGALKLNLGGAPAGPAGTGKTESVKDLAKGVAKQCVVFNCSEGMDFRMVAKFFKGLASAGAWCCFDEFNRINIEVLSVIAQQLQQLFAAKATGEEELIFEESHIRVKPTFCVFITMNPGYAGRTELPDNLKALFRPVAMMVPDYAIIAAIMLYSFGFQSAMDLARKMVVTFKLASEQLSSQCHYDYGMRAVRSVINQAGILKTAEPDENEDLLLLRALRDVNVPKFLNIDLPLFENIITDLFPGIIRPPIDYGELTQSIYRACASKNLQKLELFTEKVLQLYDTIRVRHGLMLVGPTGGAKTENVRILAKAMSDIKHLEDFDNVNVHTVNPKSMTMGQLYGEVDRQTQEWIDGILAIIIENSAHDQSPDRHWVVLDGPVDSLWIENMNTVLDDNKKLCLNSGKIIHLSEKMTMMFEVEDLEVASPATVSRCGMVYQEPTLIGLKPLFQTWLDRQPDYFLDNPNFSSSLTRLYDAIVEDAIDFKAHHLMELVITIDSNIVQSIYRIIDCFISPFMRTEIKEPKKEDIEYMISCLDDVFIFALVWSIGSTTTLDTKFILNQKAIDIKK